MVKFEQLFPGGFPSTIYIKFAIDIEAFNQGMGHGYPSGFHGVVFVVVELSYLLVVEVGYLSTV
jgi:hypothetical protein